MHAQSASWRDGRFGFGDTSGMFEPQGQIQKQSRAWLSPEAVDGLRRGQASAECSSVCTKRLESRLPLSAMLHQWTPPWYVPSDRLVRLPSTRWRKGNGPFQGEISALPASRSRNFWLGCVSRPPCLPEPLAPMFPSVCERLQDLWVSHVRPARAGWRRPSLNHARPPLEGGATAFGTRKRQKRSGKGPEKMRRRCLFSIYRCLGTGHLEKHLTAV